MNCFKIVFFIAAELIAFIFILKQVIKVCSKATINLTIIFVLSCPFIFIMAYFVVFIVISYFAVKFVLVFTFDIRVVSFFKPLFMYFTFILAIFI
jgi:hypothetical protein